MGQAELSSSGPNSRLKADSPSERRYVSLFKVWVPGLSLSFCQVVQDLVDRRVQVAVNHSLAADKLSQRLGGCFWTDAKDVKNLLVGQIRFLCLIRRLVPYGPPLRGLSLFRCHGDSPSGACIPAED